MLWGQSVMLGNGFVCVRRGVYAVSRLAFLSLVYLLLPAARLPFSKNTYIH